MSPVSCEHVHDGPSDVNAYCVAYDILVTDTSVTLRSARKFSNQEQNGPLQLNRVHSKPTSHHSTQSVTICRYVNFFLCINLLAFRSASWIF